MPDATRWAQMVISDTLLDVTYSFGFIEVVQLLVTLSCADIKHLSPSGTQINSPSGYYLSKSSTPTLIISIFCTDIFVIHMGHLRSHIIRVCLARDTRHRAFRCIFTIPEYSTPAAMNIYLSTEARAPVERPLMPTDLGAV